MRIESREKTNERGHLEYCLYKEGGGKGKARLTQAIAFTATVIAYKSP